MRQVIYLTFLASTLCLIVSGQDTAVPISSDTASSEPAPTTKALVEPTTLPPTVQGSSTTNNETQTLKELINLKQDVFSSEQLHSSEIYLSQNDSLATNYSSSEFTLMMLTAMAQTDYVYRAIHHYDPEILANMTPPATADKDLCINHLKELEERVEKMLAESYDSHDLNLYKLLDTFGRMPAGYVQGDTFWPGSYSHCRRLQIDLKDGNKTNTRYCVASVKFNKWPKTPITQYLPIRVGVCLPEACESHYSESILANVQKLIQFNSRAMDREQIEVIELYCSPSERSTDRKWWHSTYGRYLIYGAAFWILIQVFATIRTSKRSSSKFELPRVTKEEIIEHTFLDALSITENVKLLFSRKPTLDRASKHDDITSHCEDQEPELTSVDLRITDGYKVSLMCYVIAGHLIWQLVGHMRSPLESTHIGLSNYLYLVTNEIPEFALNTLFMITGILVSYLIFDAGKAHNLYKEPKSWILFMTKRYLRLIPTYLFVFAFSKYLSKYMGSGPNWDYGTTSLSPRRRCELEPWHPALTLTANVMQNSSSCVPQGWYLANDMQFFEATPLILAILSRVPDIGPFIMKLYIVGSSLVCSYFVYNSDAPDLGPMFRMNSITHGINSVYLRSAYAMPMFRINAYLIGILVGHWLQKYKQDRVKLSIAKSEGTKGFGDGLQPSALHRRLGSLVRILVPLYMIHYTLINSTTTLTDKTIIRLAVALIYPIAYLAFPLCAGVYIMLAATGHGHKTIDHILLLPHWKPLARLTLAVLISHHEVITFIVQLQTQTVYLDFVTHASLIMFTVVACYAVGLVLYVFIELPVTKLTNKILLLASLTSNLPSWRSLVIR